MKEAADQHIGGTIILTGVELFGYLEHKDNIKWPTRSALAKLGSKVSGNESHTVLMFCGLCPILGTNAIAPSDLSDKTMETKYDVQIEWNNFLENEVKKIFKQPLNCGNLNTSESCRQKNIYLQKNQPVWKIAELMSRKKKHFKAIFLDMNRILEDTIIEIQHREKEDTEDFWPEVEAYVA